MPTKLKNLKVRKVDFVDQGANPEAHIKIKKNKEESKGEKESVVKRFFTAIAKASGLKQEELESVVEEIAKGESVTFGEKMNEVKRRKVADEIWDMCYALQSSLCSIMFDDDLESDTAQDAMQQSISEFSEIVNECITQWSQRKTSNIKKSITPKPTVFDVEKMTEIIGKATVPIKTEQPIEDDEREEGEEIMIDKSKMTPAERAFYEDIEKRCSVTEEPASSAAEGTVQEPVGKSANPTNAPQILQTVEQIEDVYKGVHPAVAAEIEELKKFRQDAEEKELAQVAKKYAVIGKKEEELMPLLKSLKAAGGTAYNDMIAILDQTVEAVEKSGVFSEIGKSGHESSGGNSAEVKISEIAKGYMEKDPSISYSAAVAKAWENNPDILNEYDEEEGF